MPLWGKVSTNSAAKPKYLNSTGSFYNKSQCEGVTVDDAKATDGLLTSGWTQVHVLSKGGVSGIVVGFGGTGYSNSSVVTLTPAAGDTGTGATASVTTNGSGVIVSSTVTAAGSGYGVPPTVSVANGSGAQLIAQTSGRKQFEPLVAMSSMTS